jgi:hypothetical protein
LRVLAVACFVVGVPVIVVGLVLGLPNISKPWRIGARMFSNRPAVSRGRVQSASFGAVRSICQQNPLGVARSAPVRSVNDWPCTAAQGATSGHTEHAVLSGNRAQALDLVMPTLHDARL